MAGKKKKGSRRSKGNALMPFNKQGIKIGTLLAESGLVLAAFEKGGFAPTSAADQFKAGDYYRAGWYYLNNLNPMASNSGKLLAVGAGLGLLGRYMGLTRLGPIQFR